MHARLLAGSAVQCKCKCNSHLRTLVLRVYLLTYLLVLSATATNRVNRMPYLDTGVFTTDNLSK